MQTFFAALTLDKWDMHSVSPGNAGASRPTINVQSPKLARECNGVSPVSGDMLCPSVCCPSLQYTVTEPDKCVQVFGKHDLSARSERQANQKQQQSCQVWRPGEKSIAYRGLWQVESNNASWREKSSCLGKPAKCNWDSAISLSNGR